MEAAVSAAKVTTDADAKASTNAVSNKTEEQQIIEAASKYAMAINKLVTSSKVTILKTKSGFSYVIVLPQPAGASYGLLLKKQDNVWTVLFMGNPPTAEQLSTAGAPSDIAQ